MAPPSEDTPAAWPAVIALLAAVGLAIAAHLQLKRHGLLTPERLVPESCTPSRELVCTDVEHVERPPEAEE